MDEPVDILIWLKLVLNTGDAPRLYKGLESLRVIVEVCCIKS